MSSDDLLAQLAKTGRPKVHVDNAARQRAYRARKGTPVQVFLEPELLAELDAFRTRRAERVGGDTSRATVIAFLLRTQLLRKR
jgi:hypothetical protein